AVTGAALIIVAALRDTATERRGAAILVGTLIASLAVAYVLPARQLDLVSWLGRFVLFAIVGEIFLWRMITLARGAIRWSDARNATPFAAAVVAVAAIAPLPIDRTPLAAFALLLVASAAISLALARALEELALAPRPTATTSISRSSAGPSSRCRPRRKRQGCARSSAIGLWSSGGSRSSSSSR